MPELDSRFVPYAHYPLEMRKQELDGAVLCHFCTQKGRCLIEKRCSRAGWCSFFDPHKTSYFNRRARISVCPERLVPIIGRLMSLVKVAVRICAVSEPVVDRRVIGRCPNCDERLNLPDIPDFQCSRCRGRLAQRDLLGRRRTSANPVTYRMQQIDAELPNYVEWLLRKFVRRDRKMREILRHCISKPELPEA